MVHGLEFCEGARAAIFGSFTMCWTSYFVSDSVSTLKVGIISPILQMRKPGLREAEKLAQGHDRKLQNQNSYRERPGGMFYIYSFVSLASVPRKMLNTDH